MTEPGGAPLLSMVVAAPSRVDWGGAGVTGHMETFRSRRESEAASLNERDY